ncbi:MAG: DUF4038 domain-containing protein [Spirochaetaceae bacterium]|nr:MAG: DUF4038 domain-containing protein [Spirochaetaceae bacterium]
MRKISVADSGTFFEADKRPFFFFADTVWAAFSNATEEEWDVFTQYRAEQGFNTLQISVMPVLHDASDTYVGPTPYASKGGYARGPWDFTKPSDEYFEKAERMVALAAERGLTTCLVLLWNNYVPGTWANTRRPDVTIPKELVAEYSSFVANRFKSYNPVYFIAGDTRFETDEITEYFMIGLDAVKKADPSALTAMHITGNNSDLPAVVVDSPLLDFYTYQSGHRIEHIHNTWKLAEQFREKYPTRPIVNSEPCYEGHGHAGGVYGRWNAFDLRRAFWTSVLSGANAGFTYGAHGVWSWHRRGGEFTSVPNSRIPFHWSTGMAFDGGWDCAFSKNVFEQYGLWEAEPAQDIIPDAPEGVRAARAASGSGRQVVAVYMPCADPVTVTVDDAAKYRFTIVDIERRQYLGAEVSTVDGGAVVVLPERNTDYLIIGEKAR